MANWKFMSLFLFVSMPFLSSIFPVEDDVGHTFTIFCCAISGVLFYWWWGPFLNISGQSTGDNVNMDIEPLRY